MNPGFYIVIALVFALLGGLGYSYHIGHSQGEMVCNEEKLQAELTKKNKEIEIQEELSRFQQEQLGEAFKQSEEQKARADGLQTYIDNIPPPTPNKPTHCITPGLRDEIIKFRHGTKDKNS